MSRPGWRYGRTLDDTGNVRYWSPSSLTLGDPTDSTGCPRKWWYEKIQGLKAPETAAQRAGTALHAEIEEFLKTGVNKLGSLAMRGLPAIPEPGEDLGLEWDMVVHPDDEMVARDAEMEGRHKDAQEIRARSILENAPLRAAGVPVTGYIDLIHRRGTNKGTADIEDTMDPPGTVEVLDWKCLAAGSEVFDLATASRRDVADPGGLLVPTVFGVPYGDMPGASGVNRRLAAAQAQSHAQGIKRCVKLHLSDGSAVVASMDHPVLTTRGWLPAASVLTTDFVAVAAEMPTPVTPTRATDDEVKFVAYMLSDGGCSQPTMRFTNMTPAVIAEWRAVSTALGYTVRENRSESLAREFSLARGGRRDADQIREHWDLRGLAKNKRAHARVWGLPLPQVALFLNRFWACDGYVTDHSLGVELASEKLLDDLRFLLLRLGIRSRKTSRLRPETSSWILSLNGATALRFLDLVGNVFGKERACQQLRVKLEGQSRHAVTDQIPLDRAAVHEICDELGITAGRGRCDVFAELIPSKCGHVARDRFTAFCRRTKYEGKHARLVIAGIAWEPVREVADAGALPVYDLSVPATRNFVANGIVVHNTTSKPIYIKTPAEMSRTIQMTTYGKWALTVWPQTTHVRLSHVYFVTRGSHAPRKVTLRLLPEQIERQWEHVDAVARSLVHVARLKEAREVPANTRACEAFGGCPHRSYCPATPHNSFAARLRASGNMVKHDMTTPAKPTSILGRKTLGKPAETPATPTPPAPDPVSLAAEKRRLAREEAEARYPGLLKQWEEIRGFGIGTPQVTGELAQALADLRGLDYQGQGLSAEAGELAKFTFDDPAVIPEVLQELRDEAAAATGQEAAPVAAPAPKTDKVVLDALVPSDTPDAKPVTPPAADAAPAGEKRGPGRPPGVKNKPKADAPAETAPVAPAPATLDATPAPASAPVEMPKFVLIDTTAPSAGSQVVFYIDAVPSCAHQSFWPVVNAIIAEMHEEAGDVPDFRLTGNDHKFGYGRWKAFMTAAVKAEIAELAAGHYVLDGAMGEIGQVVAEALRGLDPARGYVVRPAR